MYTIKEVTNKKTWEDFLTDPSVSFYPFFQSWNFGDVQKKLGNTVWRLGVWRDDKLVSLCQVVYVAARRGHYLHLRHGPVLKPFDKEVFVLLIDYIKQIAKGKNTAFIRMSPVVPKEFVDYQMIKKLGFLNAPIHRMDAEICWVLDITKSEEQLLARMRKSHRYLIRKGDMNQKLRIRKTKNTQDLDFFSPLYQQLAQRKHFIPHRGIQEEFEIFGKDSQEVLFLAAYDNKIIAAALIAFVGNMAIYRHSTSDEMYKHIPAMYSIQWEAIKEARKRGKKLYNFWGIAGKDAPKRHPWQGHTLFKTGFGGYRLELLHAQELPLSIFYWKTYVIEYVSKLFRGY